MSRNDHDHAGEKPLTRLVRSGRGQALTGPFVNPPVVHASTVLFETSDDLLSGQQRYTYGRRGTPTIEALEATMSEMEGAEGSVLCPSGLSAVSTALLSVLRAGDHLLMADNVYDPARNVATGILQRMGVETTFFAPEIGAGIATLFKPNTRAVYLESPGSLTFEVSDIPAIAAAAHKVGASVLMDNTWATPLFFQPLKHGVDLSIQAATKYIGGHADVMLGYVAANQAHAARLADTHGTLGLYASGDDCFLALRGLRTLPTRLARHQASGIALATWLAARPEVARVLHPALPTDPGHALWKRDFSGACGLFGVELKPVADKAVAAMLEGLAHFGMGWSWGGFESLAIPAHIHRTVRPFAANGPVLRIHAGLEDPDDLIGDLQKGFARLAGAL